MSTVANPLYRLFHSPGACSLAPHIVLEELRESCAIHYEPVPVVIAEGANRSPAYLAINPRGRVPALAYRDEAGQEQILTEAMAILLFLGGRHPEAGLVPTEPMAFIRLVEWMSWLASTLHQAGVRTVFRPERFTTATDKAAHEGIAAQGRIAVRAGFAEIEAKLAGRAFALGDRFSVLDAYLVVFYRWGGRCGLTMRAEFPGFATLIDGLRARPAVARVIARERLQME